MTPNRKHATLSLAAAMLIFSSGTVFAQDDRQQARGQRGGIAGAVPNGNQGRAVEPALPLEPPVTLPDTLPIVEAPAQVTPARSQAPSLPPDLGALEDSSEMPFLPELGEPSQSNQLPSLPALGEPSQTDQFVTITQEPGAETEKKPGFFKRMWTKVKGFVSGVKDKVTNAIAKNRAKRAERKALEASSQNSQSAQVFDADIYQGGGDGGSSGGAAE